METNFIKVRSTKDIIVSSSIILLGCILAVLPIGTGVNLAGSTLIIAGIILALALKSSYKESSSSEKYHKKEYCFLQESKSSILNAISKNPASVDISQNGKGQALRLDIYYSKGAGDAYIQLFEYIPHQYKPCSELYVYEIDRVKTLIS